jgi:hypothetical protein
VLAGNHNFTIDQGAHFESLITVRNEDDSLFNFTDYHARMQIRLEVDSEDFIAELTTENGGIVLGGDDGTLRVVMDAEITDMINREGVYDIEIIDNTDKVYRLLKGKIRLNLEVTR